MSIDSKWLQLLAALLTGCALFALMALAGVHDDYGPVAFLAAAFLWSR